MADIKKPPLTSGALNTFILVTTTINTGLGYLANKTARTTITVTIFDVYFAAISKLSVAIGITGTA